MIAGIVSEQLQDVLGTTLIVWHLVAEARLIPHADARCAAVMHAAGLGRALGAAKSGSSPLCVSCGQPDGVGACMRLHISSSASQP